MLEYKRSVRAPSPLNVARSRRQLSFRVQESSCHTYSNKSKRVSFAYSATTLAALSAITVALSSLTGHDHPTQSLPKLCSRPSHITLAMRPQRQFTDRLEAIPVPANNDLHHTQQQQVLLHSATHQTRSSTSLSSTCVSAEPLYLFIDMGSVHVKLEPMYPVQKTTGD